MFCENKILVGKEIDTGEDVFLYPSKANRHGLIAGATGTGKTVSLKVLAESFSNCGVPVFLADAKGDLSGMAEAGTMSENLQKRIDAMGLMERGFGFQNFPAVFWDVYQKGGIPLRTTISEMGPMLLAKVLGLNDTQTDVLSIVFKIADDEKLMLYDTKDLRAMLNHVNEGAGEYSMKYGNIATATVAAILRALVTLESDGGEIFFGETAINIMDWLKVSPEGRGYMHILDCRELLFHPSMYATFLLWMMSELFESLPEVGDLDKPKLVFFFDEAHMLFEGANATLVSKVEQLVKLIRSKGVGIYFITQSPSDIPDGVLSQLGNKIQHALFAYTPAEQKKVKAAAQSFRVNENLDTVQAISELGVGEALVSVMDESGIPTVVKKCKILPPQSKMGIIDDALRSKCIMESEYYQKYYPYVDSPSAYEYLMQAQAQPAPQAQEPVQQPVPPAQQTAQMEQQAPQMQAQPAQETPEPRKLTETEKLMQKLYGDKKDEGQGKETETEKMMRQIQEKKEKKKQTVAQKQMKSTGRSVAGHVGREIGNVAGSSMSTKAGKRLMGNAGASFARGLFSTFVK